MAGSPIKGVCVLLFFVRFVRGLLQSLPTSEAEANVSAYDDHVRARDGQGPLEVAGTWVTPPHEMIPAIRPRSWPFINENAKAILCRPMISKNLLDFHHKLLAWDCSIIPRDNLRLVLCWIMIVGRMNGNKVLQPMIIMLFQADAKSCSEGSTLALLELSRPSFIVALHSFGCARCPEADCPFSSSRRLRFSPVNQLLSILGPSLQLFII